ncbi:hypothetical protein BCR39DRAFT_498984 [Naematelia encephala]|uniref:asparagine--tRNA ligase n=1 Tax=Naematelia encephala TaxID=71784 RepID=A0A1Y2AT30_9TREE|nr:hypothetical protein BCR39DRAFT_498984 [Naematelia encephala]
MRATATLRSSLPSTIRSILSPISAGSSGSTTIYGWLTSVRVHKKVTFVQVSDGSGTAQAVFKHGNEDSERPTLPLSIGASVRLTGRLSASRGSGQVSELLVENAEILGTCDPEEYPIQKKELSASYLRHNAHLRFRTTSSAALTRMRDGLMRDWHDWFEENEFTHIHTPILTASDCEGGGEIFTLRDSSLIPTSSSSDSSTPTLSSTPSGSSPSTSLSSSSSSIPSSPSPSPSSLTLSSSTIPPEPFFPHPVNLTVSSQLHLEAPTHSLSRTYTLSPCFRAEPSVTSRHLCEFYMLEAEMAFVSTLDTLLDVVESGIRGVLDRLLNDKGTRAIRMRQDLKLDSLEMLQDTIRQPFGRMTYTDAVGMLKERHEQEPFKSTPEWGIGLSTEQEKWLAGHARKPIFVTHFPASIKPFYMLPSDAQSKGRTAGQSEDGQPLSPGPTVAAFDLLIPGIGELIGGSLREYRLEQLMQSIERAGLNKEEYQWYLDLRRYGSVPHGGWGMGFDRWIMWVCGVGNVREVVPFPRWKGHCQY